jgi:hypothetical protein
MPGVRQLVDPGILAVIGIRSTAGWDFYCQNYKTESKGGGRLTNTGLGLCTAI